jgi:DNA-binding LacI/PurR family transcriptional regulator
MRAAAELSYRPDQRARLLGSSRSRTVGVVFGLLNEFHGELIDALYRAAEHSEYDLALGATTPSRSGRRAVQSLLDFRCEAIILIGSSLPGTAIEELAEQVPTVVMTRAMRSRAVDVVRTDDVTGAKLAVEHLVQLGHQRIAHVHGQRVAGAAERRSGYRAAMKRAGLESEIRLIPGGLSESDGENAATELLAEPSISAVIAFNDHCAAGILTAVRGAGVAVPGDLSLIGYDNSGIARLRSVALTTVGQDANVLAKSALDRAVGWAEDTISETCEIVVPPRLQRRATDAAFSAVR